eukprot:COSAG01_NODE_68976_length_262_cov_1.822086_1_plen_20_part_10
MDVQSYASKPYAAIIKHTVG